MPNTIRYRPDGTIDLVDETIAEPKAGELQIWGGVCGICSWDIATARLGEEMQPPAPAGHEGMGYVAKVGADVSGFKEGDRVAGGGFSRLRNLPAATVARIPACDIPDEYWMVEPVSCAITGLDHCRIQPGNRVALIGCGFMGLLILQGLLTHPLGDLVVLDINAKRLELARRLGAGDTYNVHDEEIDALSGELKSRKFDVVVDASGSQAGLDLATEIARKGGIINLFGWIKGQSAHFDPTKWHMGGFTIINSSPSARIRETMPAAVDLIERGVFNLEPLVTHVVPLPEYPSLMKQVLDGDDSYVKGVVRLD